MDEGGPSGDRESDGFSNLSEPDGFTQWAVPLGKESLCWLHFGPLAAMSWCVMQQADFILECGGLGLVEICRKSASSMLECWESLHDDPVEWL